jgi:hypothetical protein
MENNHKLALYPCYYLARFDLAAVKNLGYKNWQAAYKDIGEKLGCKPSSINNWRDEFDPLFPHRAGWYQRPMSPSRVGVAQALDHLDERQIRRIVQDILSGVIAETHDEAQILLSTATEDAVNKSAAAFAPRGVTGNAAEEFFRNFFEGHRKPIDGMLHDCRELGTGYDFKIETSTSIAFVEVKGLAGSNGGVLFTDKEWSVAQSEGDNYYLCLVTNVADRPTLKIIQNPAQKLSPKLHLYPSIQVSWCITENQLSAIDD